MIRNIDDGQSFSFSVEDEVQLRNNAIETEISKLDRKLKDFVESFDRRLNYLSYNISDLYKKLDFLYFLYNRNRITKIKHFFSTKKLMSDYEKWRDNFKHPIIYYDK